MKELAGAPVATGAAVHLCFPFEDLEGREGLADAAYGPMLDALPDAERRDFLVMRGTSGGDDWVGCAGHYVGTFRRPWLGIPPTGRPVHVRYAEFFRMEGGEAVEVQAVWDLPSLMVQAGAWPLAPSLGVEWMAPGPASTDGLAREPRDSEEGAASLRLVADMLEGLHRSPEGVEAMGLDRYWHPDCLWYGPGGIGTTRGIGGFRADHQIPFLDAMPDRRAHVDGAAFFADGPYVGYTAWPGMEMTLTGGGWLGIAAAGQRLTMRSLDFWRCEAGLIRENWVLIDLLHVYDQLGVDVLARMRQLAYGSKEPR